MFENLEAIINILANCSEIIAFVGGLPLVLTCYFPAVFGLRGYSLKLMIAGFYTVIAGLFAPVLFNVLIRSFCPERAVNAPLMVIVALALVICVSLVAVFVGFLALPSIIAFRENRPKKKAILVCNILLLVPFSWLLAYVWACMPGENAQSA